MNILDALIGIARAAQQTLFGGIASIQLRLDEHSKRLDSVASTGKHSIEIATASESVLRNIVKLLLDLQAPPSEQVMTPISYLAAEVDRLKREMHARNAQNLPVNPPSPKVDEWWLRPNGRAPQSTK